MDQAGILFTNSICNFCCRPKVSDIKKEYGTPPQAYSLTEHIWMTPKRISNPSTVRIILRVAVYRYIATAKAELPQLVLE